MASKYSGSHVIIESSNQRKKRLVKARCLHTTQYRLSGTVPVDYVPVSKIQ